MFIFSNLKKFDGKKLRNLNISEIGQIAGRAGRYLNDGIFGTTGECKIQPEEKKHWKSWLRSKKKKIKFLKIIIKIFRR